MPISSGLIADWQMLEGTGTTVADASGSGHVLTLAAPPTWLGGGGLGFNGGSQYCTSAISNNSVLTLTIVGTYLFNGASVLDICGSYVGGSGPGIGYGLGQQQIFGKTWPLTDGSGWTSSAPRTYNIGVRVGTAGMVTPSEDLVLENELFELSWTFPGGSFGDQYYRGPNPVGYTTVPPDNSAIDRGKNLNVGFNFANSTAFNGNIYRILVYSRALSGSEVAANSAELATWAAGRGYGATNTPNPITNPVYLAEGDSITAGLGAGVTRPWPQILAESLPGGGAILYDVGIGGQLVATMSGSLTRYDQTFAPAAPYNWCTVMGGTNDLSGGARTPAAVFPSLVAVVNYHAALGRIGAVLPILDNVSTDPSITAAYNALIAAHSWPTGWKAIPTSLLPHLCPAGSNSNTTWFADGTHPTQVGNNEMARAVLLGYYGTTGGGTMGSRIFTGF